MRKTTFRESHSSSGRLGRTVLDDWSIIRGGQVPKISLHNVCHKSPGFWEKNWESYVTKSRFFSGPQTKFVTLTKHCPFQHLCS